MMHLNHGKYFFKSLEKKVGIIPRKRPFRLIMKLYITVRKLQMSSITALFLLDTIWQKNITCNVNTLIYVNSVNNSVVVQHVSVVQVRNVMLLLFATTRSVFKSVKVSVVEIAKRTN